MTSAPPPVLVLGGRPLPLVDRARVYACGITPYDVTHLGHASTFVWVDVLGRLLSQLGAEPLVCRNVTDVDDVLTAAAARAGEHYDVFASMTQFRFERDLAALGVRSPRYEPRARTHVGSVIALAAGLLEVGAAYSSGGTVWFRGGAVPAAAGVDVETARVLAEQFGDRGEDGREAEFDVPVWRARTDIPSFESPWGTGVPGWHAECAAMSLAVLGSSVDVQCGGADLAFPHHAYQAAMVEALTGVRPYARSALRVGTVGIGGAPMAKSTGNLVLVADVLAAHPPAVLRLLLLDRRWDTGWEYDPADLDPAATRLDALYAGAGTGTAGAGGEEVLALLCDDLDVPAAVEVALAEGGGAARTLLAVLGLGA